MHLFMGALNICVSDICASSVICCCQLLLKTSEWKISQVINCYLRLIIVFILPFKIDKNEIQEMKTIIVISMYIHFVLFLAITSYESSVYIK